MPAPYQIDWRKPHNKGLVAWWPFAKRGGSVLDEAVRGHRGVFTGGTPVWTSGPVRHCGSVDFDPAAADYFDLPDENAIFSGLLHWTVIGNIWMNSGAADNASPFFGDNALSSHPNVRYDTGTGKLEWTALNASTWILFVEKHTNTFPADQWHQIGCSFNGSTKAFTLWLNGEADRTGTGSASGALVDSSGTRIGGGQSASANPWDGKISDVRVYDRFLTTADAATIWRESKRSHFGTGVKRRVFPVLPATTATITGTATASITESDVVTGGKTIIITLTGDTFKAAGTGPIGTTAQSQALLDNIDSAQAEAFGWDAEVKANLVPATHLVRDSSTQATVTLPASASYDITAQETITVTVPTDVLVTGAAAITGSPTFTVDTVAVGTASIIGCGIGAGIIG